MRVLNEQEFEEAIERSVFKGGVAFLTTFAKCFCNDFHFFKENRNLQIHLKTAQL